MRRNTHNQLLRLSNRETRIPIADIIALDEVCVECFYTDKFLFISIDNLSISSSIDLAL